MSKIRRGNLVFVVQVGDHPPRHVHVFRDAKLVVKWDLENRREMKGRASARVRRILAELEEEGLL